MSDEMLVQHLIEECTDPGITGEDTCDLMHRGADEIVRLRAQLAEAEEHLAADAEENELFTQLLAARRAEIAALNEKLTEAEADTRRLDKLLELMSHAVFALRDSDDSVNTLSALALTEENGRAELDKALAQGREADG